MLFVFFFFFAFYQMQVKSNSFFAEDIAKIIFFAHIHI